MKPRKPKNECIETFATHEGRSYRRAEVRLKYRDGHVTLSDLAGRIHVDFAAMREVAQYLIEAADYAEYRMQLAADKA